MKVTRQIGSHVFLILEPYFAYFKWIVKFKRFILISLRGHILGNDILFEGYQQFVDISTHD